MPPINVNWSDLEIAFERNSPDQESFLDLENGDLLSIIEGEPDAAARRARVAAHPDRFLRVDPASSREQYRWMERFVGSVSEPALRERLLIAIDGKGAFRRFKDVLLNYPAERERWFTYRAQLLHWAMKKWLEKEQLQPKEAPPWGVAPEPKEDEVVLERPAAQNGEGPGEILRRQAKELIDQIPAVELPAAIAFLDFLRERGIGELARVKTTTPVKRTAA